MQISLRSQMIAGTAAVVGASAIALTPVVAQHEMLPNIQVPSASAVVSLAGFNSPISELLTTLGQAGNFIFQTSNAAAQYYPFIGTPLAYADVISPLGQSFTAAGLLPQIINDHLPIISQLGKNGSAYIGSSVNGLLTAFQDVNEGAWNALGAALSLDIPSALTYLVDGISDAGTILLQSGNFVLTNVVDHVTNLLTALPTLVTGVFDAAVGQAQVLLGTVVKYVNDIVDAVGTGNPETIWNTVVDGAFGPTGILGVTTALTIGAGVQLPPPDYPDGTVVPSLRGVIQGAIKGVSLLISPIDSTDKVPPPPSVAATPVAAKSVASSAAALRSAPAPAVASEGGSDAVTGDNGGGAKASTKSSSSSDSGSDRGASKASKH